LDSLTYCGVHCLRFIAITAISYRSHSLVLLYGWFDATVVNDDYNTTTAILSRLNRLHSNSSSVFLPVDFARICYEGPQERNADGVGSEASRGWKWARGIPSQLTTGLRECHMLPSRVRGTDPTEDQLHVCSKFYRMPLMADLTRI